MRDLQFDREPREEMVHDVNPAECHHQKCSQLRHEVRGVEEMKRLENAESNQKINYEDPKNVSSANRQNLRPQPANAEEKRDCEKQNREGAGINTVKKRRNADKRQKPSPASRQLPKRRRGAAA